jgi:hypothetical protein
MLAGCALSSASNSFMSGMHPSQEFCTSRGYTLDATTKQCVEPPSTSPATETTGSLPQNLQKSAPSQSGAAAPTTVAIASPPVSSSATPPPERPRPLVPVEPNAVIYAELNDNFELMTELTHYVRASGYRCDSISALAPLPYARGFKFVCNHFSYKYAIEEKAGRSIVTVE